MATPAKNATNRKNISLVIDNTITLNLGYLAGFEFILGQIYLALKLIFSRDEELEGDFIRELRYFEMDMTPNCPRTPEK